MNVKTQEAARPPAPYMQLWMIRPCGGVYVGQVWTWRQIRFRTQRNWQVGSFHEPSQGQQDAIDICTVQNSSEFTGQFTETYI